jgi:hypothetical protein
MDVKLTVVRVEAGMGCLRSIVPFVVLMMGKGWRKTGIYMMSRTQHSQLSFAMALQYAILRAVIHRYRKALISAIQICMPAHLAVKRAGVL